MRKTIYICDRCGKEIKERYFVAIGKMDENGDPADLPEDMQHYGGLDFCEDCTGALIRTIKGYSGYDKLVLEEEPEEKPEEKPEEEQDTDHKPVNKYGKDGRKLDEGLIQALRNAGWKWKDIREEYKHRYKQDVPECTLIAHYNKYKQIMEEVKNDVSGVENDSCAAEEISD